jgi:drug/metabolite transporter (DMT)-like permease
MAEPTSPALACTAPPAASRPPRAGSGAAASMLTAMAGFALADLFAKRLGGAGMPALELVSLRLLCLALWLGWLLVRGARLRRPRHPWLQGLRGLCIVGSALLFVAGLARLPLATGTALVFSSPIFVTLLSVAVLRERVPARRWLWVTMGFVGVLIVAGPSPASFQAAALLPVASSLLWAVAMVCTRRIGHADDAFTTQVCSCAMGLACAALLLGGKLRAPALLSGAQWIEALAMGVAWTFAQWQVARAYTRAEASSVAPLAYTQMLWAGLLAWLVLQQPPSLRAVASSTVIALAGLGMLRTGAR